MKSDRAIKSIACFCFILIGIAVLVIHNSPAIGYESSVYWSTPSLAWGCLIFSIACGIGIAVHQVYRKEEHGNLWVLGFALILVSNLVILSLPATRGYFMWNATGDAGSHLGWIQDILISGHINLTNFYPIVHIYSAQICQVLDTTPELLLRWILLIFGVLSMLFMYFAARALLPQKGQVILATIAGTALLHGWYTTFSPNSLGNLFFPLALYLMVRSFSPGTTQWRGLFTIIIFLFAPFHPVPALALLAILAVIWLPEKLAPLLRTDKALISKNHSFNLHIVAMFLLLVWAVAWISSFGIWDTTLHNLHTLATEGGGKTHLQVLAGNIRYAQSYGYSVMEEFIKVYGGIVLLIIPALIALPVLWRKLSTERELGKVFALYGPIALVGLLMAIFYLVNLNFGPGRLMIYIVILCAPLAGYLLFEFMQWMKARKSWQGTVASVLVGVLLFSAALNGILKLYPSPYLLGVSLQSTQTEIEGMDWFLHKKDFNIYSSGWYYVPHRYANFLLSYEERKERKDTSPYVTTALPFHLGYDQYSSLGQHYEKDTYVVIRELNRRVYIDVYPDMSPIRLLPDDFEELEQDESVDKLYSNGGFDTYYVRSV